MMMSFALMGCLIFGASDASAQGRSRSQGGSTSSRSQSAAVSRSSNASAPTVTRNSSPSTSRSSATPQVSRSSSTSSRSSASTPQVSRSSSTTTSRSATTPQVNRSTSQSSNSGTSVIRGATTRGGDNTKSTVSSHNSTLQRSDNTSGSSIKSTKPGIDSNKGGMDKPGDNKGKYDNDRKGNRGDRGNRNGNGGIDNDHKGKGNGNNGNRPGNNGNRPGNNGKHDNDRNGNKGHGNHNGRHGDSGKHGGNQGYNHNHRYDYNGHHYRNEFAWNYSHHSWSRPLPPPVRAHRPAPLVWYRPVIPAGWHPYAGAPVIDRILGIMFGTLYEASLDHLYYNGYFIDGYADGIIYLRDVPMLNLYWPDVMLNYDYDRLVNAQFVYHSSYYDTGRYNRVYKSLSRLYGPPVYRDGMTISWYGGNNTGWVTLSLNESYGDYYTTMSIGY